MARKRRSRRRRRGLGSVLTVRRSGLGQIGAGLKYATPILIGAGATAGTVAGLRMYADPAASETQQFLYKHAPWVGLGVGLLGSGLVYMVLKGRGMGREALWASGAASVATAVTWFAADKLLEQGRGPIATAGLGAVVPEYSGHLGALVMEPTASRGYGAGPLGSYGEEVNLGAVSSSVFGTPGFRV